MDRRTFLQRSGAGASALALSALVGACGRGISRVTGDLSGSSGAKALGHSLVDGLPVAAWVVAENKKKGSLSWVINGRRQVGKKPIEGYADRVSAVVGEELTIFVNTTASTWKAEIYRMGYYQGLGGRLITKTRDISGFVQPASIFTPKVNMVHCDWKVSHRFLIGDDWPPGNYLVQLIASSGGRHHIPFTVRDDSSRAAIAIQNSVTTWQAYNHWGGYSLYGGIPIDGKSDYESRSRIVSFDRPYANPDAGGSGDWIGNEFPFIYFAERHGLDVTYLTNVDVDARPHLLANHRVLVSLGHDEYWSYVMRYGVQDAARNGLNVAFLGANACYRQIRFASSALGQRREVICYKDVQEDPIHLKKPWLATGGSWATSGPSQVPESQFVGAMYQNFGGSGDLVIYEPTSFIFKGMKLHRGSTIPKIIGSEFDAFEPRICPQNVEILAHSPTKGVVGESDMTYYTIAKGGGIFDSGTADFVTAMWNGDSALNNHLSFAVTPAAAPLGEMMLNLLRTFANGPAAKTHPSRPNWRSLYAESAPVKLGVDVR